MNIVHAVGWYFPESIGGTEVYVAGLAALQMAAAHRVTVIVPQPGGTATTADRHRGVAVWRWPTPATPTRAEARGEQPVRGVERLVEWLADERPEVFHLHSFVTGLGLWELRAARAAGARTVVTMHTPGLGYLCARGTLFEGGLAPCDGVAVPSRCAECLLEQRGAPAAVSAALAAVPLSASRALGHFPGRAGSAVGMAAFVEDNLRRQRELFTDADAVIVLTRWAANALAAAGAPREKIHVNPLGVAEQFLADVPRAPRDVLPRDERPLVVGFVGRLEPLKGVAVLAAALQRIPHAVNLRVQVYGVVQGTAEAAERESLRRMAAMDARLEVLERVPREQMASVLAGFDVLCCPSLALEGGPTVALEAMAVGTPVVGSRIGGLAEHVDDGRTGALVPPGDIDALAAVLTALAGDALIVARWRAALPRPRSMPDVCEATMRVYEGA